MSTLTTGFAELPEPIFRLSVAQYHAMISGGVLTDDDPVELLEGILVFKMPKNPPHETAVGKIQDVLPALIPRGWHVRLQAPITLSDSELEPDVAVVKGNRSDYANHHPGPGEVALVIEVADTTLERDRSIKLRAYARAGIPVYGILNLLDRQLELHAGPVSEADNATYLNKTIISWQGIACLLVGQKSIELPVEAMLP